jgi:hypothetical protein
MIIGIGGEESRRRNYVMLVVIHKSQSSNPLRRKVPANRGCVKFSTEIFPNFVPYSNRDFVRSLGSECR